MLEQYQLPQHILDLADRLNVSDKSLKANHYLFECLYLRTEVHKALVEITHVDEQSLLSREGLQNDLRQSLEDNDFTFLGLDHNSYRSHEYIALMLSQLNEPITLAVEYPSWVQKHIDFFLQTGKFREIDNANLYLEIYNQYQRNFSAVGISEDLKGTFFDEIPQLVQIYPILLAARAKRISVFCFDLSHEEEQRTAESEMLMKESLLNQATGPTAVIVGSDHTIKGEYVQQKNNITSVRTLCEREGKKVKSYFFDSYQDIYFSWMEDEVTETVMHAAVTKKADAQGMSDKLIGYNEPSMQSILGREMYVAVR